MGFWKNVKKKVKEWFGGGNSNASANVSAPRVAPPKPRIVYNNRDSRNQTVSSGFNKRSFLDSFKSDSGSEQKEEKRVQNAFKASTYSYKSLSDNNKESSLEKLDKALKKDVPDPKQAAAKAAYDKRQARLKADYEQRKADKDARQAYRQEKHAAYHTATNHRYDVAEKGISKEERDRRKQNIRTATLGEMMGGREDEALDVMKAKMKYDKVRTSVERGVANTASAGAIKLAEKRLNKGERKKAEEYYQENKSKGGEAVGSLLGGLALYGGTAGTFEGLGTKAVGRAAETAVGKKLGAEALKRTMAGEGAKAALTRSLVGDAIQDSTIGAFDTTMDILSRDDLETPSDYAKAFAEGQAINYGMGLLGNAASHGLPVAGRAIGKRVGDFIDDSRKLRIVPKGVADVAEASKNADEAVTNGAKPTATNLKPTEEAWEEQRNNILDYLKPEPRTKVYTVQRTYESGAKRKVKIEAASEEEAIKQATAGKANVTGAKVLETSAPEPKDFAKNLAGNEPEKEFTVQKIYKSGRKYKAKVTAKDEAEALEKAINGNKGVKTAKILETSEIKPTKEEAWETQRNNILDYINEDANGAKPAAQNLKPNTEAQPKFEPQSAEDIRAHSGVKHEQKTNKEKSSEFWSSFRTKFVDSLDAFEQENKKFLKSDPERWARNNGAIDKLRRHQSMAARSIGEGQVGWNGQVLKNLDGTDAKSLKAIYDGLDKDREELFETYLLLKHAPDRADAGKPIYAGKFSTREACEEEANRILANNKDFEKRAEELYQYTRNELQNRADAGLIPQEVVDDWFKKYPHYVPTGRAGEFKPDEDIWEVAHELARNGNTIKAGDIKAASEEISGAPIRSIKEQLSEATTRNWRDMSMNNLFNRMFGDKVSAKLAAEADGGLATVLDNTVNLKSNNGKYYAEVFVDGKPQRVEVEKRFYDGIKDLLKNGRVGDAIDFASDVAAVPSYFFKNVVTSWNPIFMVKNGMRDFPEAVINSRYTKEFMESMGLARRDLYGVEGGGMWTQALRNQGVSQANFVNLEEALTKERTLLGKGVNKFATLQESVETYPRLVEFMATIKGMGYDLETGLPMKVIDALKKDGYDLSRGIGELSEDALAKVDDLVKGMGYDLNAGVRNVPMEVLDVAAANAADVTVNFGRSGSIGKMLNRGFVPFFNPSIQGFDKFIRNLSQQPSTAKLLGTVTKALALGAGVQAVNNLMLDDNPYYQQIAARDKATNIIIACPIKMEDGKVSLVDKDEANVFIKIPKSRFAAAYSLPMVNLGNENKMGWAEMIKVAGDQVAPVNPIESNILSAFALASKGEQGETWYGTPIVPEALLDKMPSEQYDANTSWFGKALGKATASLPEELQISPKKADYIIDATTGVIGDFALPMATPSRQGGSNNLLTKYGTPFVNVPKRAFTIDAVTQNDLSTRFYGARDKAEKMKNSANGGEAEKEEFDRLNSYSTEISGLNQAIRHLQDSDRATKQDDIYELQKVRNQLMQDALDGKGAPTSEKMLDAVQKYVGTTYAIESFGSSADKDAMKIYGASKYGKLSDEEMQKAIDSDENFYKGVRAIGTLEDEMTSAGVSSNSGLSKAIALASADADEELFGAYGCTKQGRTESANKMVRARTYFKDGGSTDEYVQLEKARTMGGKLSDEEKDAELENLERQLASGAISEAEYAEKENEIKYNANTSYVGLATSLALANAPERGYRLYDIKDKNIRKGQNLAAMGFTARDVREMKKAMDTNGNGYPSKQEVIDFVANSNVEDKATLFDALYPYQSRYNPFGAVTNYSRAQAAEVGRANGIEQIGSDTDDFALDIEETSGSSGYYSRRRGGYRGYGRSGGKSKVAKTPEIKQSNFKASKQTYKSLAESLSPRTKSSANANYKTASVKSKTASAKPTAKSSKSASAKVEPPKVKFKKYEV